MTYPVKLIKDISVNSSNESSREAAARVLYQLADRISDGTIDSAEIRAVTIDDTARTSAHVISVDGREDIHSEFEYIVTPADDNSDDVFDHIASSLLTFESNRDGNVTSLDMCTEFSRIPLVVSDFNSNVIGDEK